MNKYTILIPSYNDWDCLNLLIPRIDKVAYDIVGEVSILIVNDASTIRLHFHPDFIQPQLELMQTNIFLICHIQLSIYFTFW